ncbi:MAG: hypothetical protein GY856_03685, partial [bacterium]|nr:hypothetical protein [bacterium]
MAAVLHPPGGWHRPLLLRLGTDPRSGPAGLRPPGRGLLEGEEPRRRIDEMAAEYLRSIRGVWPEGPYALLGWSLGGMVAYEMARQLEEAGREVALLALVDAWAQRRQASRFDS